MKRFISLFLVVLLLLSFMAVGATPALAAEKKEPTRAIAIVFDNSGSMYTELNPSWCRATYAMEVFASMLNKGDTLQIYPMWPIEVGGQTYTMEKPFQITDSAQASKIREIYTPDADGTPIETIDCAVSGIRKVQADKKYTIVLTDGTTFDRKGVVLPNTEGELDKCFQQYANQDITFMYLGIRSNACMPNTAESGWFTKKQAADSANVLSTLTEMCNLIFGRDTLPKGRLTQNTMDIDISMKKMIVFVQGQNVSGLKVTGDSGVVGELVSTASTKYSTTGAGNYKGNNRSVPDESLQGMMVTYTNCSSGTYNIEYTGNATSMEVYYEPDADLDFIFTDANGNTVDPNALYEGDYKVSYGMKDAKTGKLIESDLLGNPHYEGSYSINGEKTPFTHDGYSGETPIFLEMDDTFEAALTVTYLSGYTITKDSSDFGWPEGGIKVATRPAGDLRLEITGGSETYELQTLEEGEPYIAKVFYQGTQLTGEDLEAVELKWESETNNADIKRDDDHYVLSMRYKDPKAPENTVCGPCTADIHAFYRASGSEEAHGVKTITYNIEDKTSPLQVDLYAIQNYIVIKELENSEPMAAQLTMNGLPLTAEEFMATQVEIDCGGLNYVAVPSPENSAYVIQLQATEGIKEGAYTIKVTAVHTDLIGRQNADEDSFKITLSAMPLWVKWLIGIGLLLALIILTFIIMRIRKTPRSVRPDTESCSLGIGGRDVTADANFTAKLSGKQIVAYVEYGGEELGRVLVGKLLPGKESYLSKPSHKRSFWVKYPENVSVSGDVKAVDVAGIEYKVDNDGNIAPAEEQQAAYTITNGASITMSGRTIINGHPKNFSAEIPMNFKKR